MLLEPLDWLEPGTWQSSVLLRLHPRETHPGLSRTLTVPLADLDRAVARDKLTDKPLADYFLEEMLADPMIRLVMQADGVAESELRTLYATTSEHPVGTANPHTASSSPDRVTDGDERELPPRPSLPEVKS